MPPEGRATVTPERHLAPSVLLAPASHHGERATVTPEMRATLDRPVHIAKAQTARRAAPVRAADRIDRHDLVTAHRRHSRLSSVNVKKRASRLAKRAGGVSLVRVPSTSPAPAKN
jgi:hypothetical protein